MCPRGAPLLLPGYLLLQTFPGVDTRNKQRHPRGVVANTEKKLDTLSADNQH